MANQDANLVACEQEHEMAHILKVYGREKTDANLADIKQKCKDFKAGDGYKPHNRENFYLYLEKEFHWKKA